MMLDLSEWRPVECGWVGFGGDNDGYLYAFDSATGKELWRFRTCARVWGIAPITYMLDGVQWVVVPSMASRLCGS